MTTTERTQSNLDAAMSPRIEGYCTHIIDQANKLKSKGRLREAARTERDLKKVMDAVNSLDKSVRISQEERDTLIAYLYWNGRSAGFNGSDPVRLEELKERVGISHSAELQRRFEKLGF